MSRGRWLDLEAAAASDVALPKKLQRRVTPTLCGAIVKLFQFLKVGLAKRNSYV